jgi:hypothetical protein
VKTCPVLLVGLSLLVSGCEPAPAIRAPKSYSESAIAFSYPGNWSITEDVTEPGDPEVRYLFIESPGAAIAIIQSFAPALDWTVEEFAEDFMASTVDEVDGGSYVGIPTRAAAGRAEPVRRSVAGQVRTGVRNRFSVSALGERVPHTSLTFRVEAADASVFLVLQAATEDWNKVEPGFDLIARSLRVD